MVAWSALAAVRTAATQCRSITWFPKMNVVRPAVVNYAGINHIQVRTCKYGHGKIYVVPSSFSWNKFKDLMHFYVLLGLIPALCVIFYVNVFIGPATLKPIPEGYEPKHWEYHSHPISRFISKYITGNPQKEYEKMCFLVFYKEEERLARATEDKVKRLIAHRRDFQAWYYSPAMTKYTRQVAKDLEDRYHTDRRYEGFPAHI